MLGILAMGMNRLSGGGDVLKKMGLLKQSIRPDGDHHTTVSAAKVVYSCLG